MYIVFLIYVNDKIKKLQDRCLDGSGNLSSTSYMYSNSTVAVEREQRIHAPLQLIDMHLIKFARRWGLCFFSKYKVACINRCILWSFDKLAIL